MKQYSVLLLAALCVASSAMAQDGATCRDAIARIAPSAASGSSGWSGFNTGVGVWMGCTVAGFLAGTILPAVHRSEQTIECK